MGAGMNTMNIHGVTRITVAEPKILNCRGGVHIRNVTIEHKGGEFEIALIGADVGEGGPVEAVTVGDTLFHDYQEACDDLATLCAERDELAGKLEAAQNVVEPTAPPTITLIKSTSSTETARCIRMVSMKKFAKRGLKP